MTKITLLFDRYLVKFTMILILMLTCISFRSNGIKKYVPGNSQNFSDSLYKPIKKDVLLFYIQLSENKNIIVYDLNCNSDKSINEKNPVHTYWIRYSEKGQIQELTYFQKRFVYGLESKLLDSTKRNFSLKFASYKKRNLYLIRNEKNDKYYPYMSIMGKLSLLSKIYIQVESGKFGLPKVNFVELHGKEISDDKYVIEKIIP